MKRSTLGWTGLWRGAAGLAALVGAATLVGPAEAADVCISQAAKDTLSACPGGKLETSSGKKPQVSFKQPPAAVNLKKRDDLTKPQNPTGQMAAAERDARRERLAARSLSLLVTEIQSTETLFSSTPKDSPDRPKLMRRLGDAYVELESAAFKEKTELEIKISDAKRAKQSTTQLEADKAKKEKTLNGAREQVIDYYTKLKKAYPKYCNGPGKNQGCGDEVLYYLAYEYEQAGKKDEARRIYKELIDNFKSSPYIPNAYFAFGELFFEEAQGNPAMWAFAEASYKNVVASPPPDNKLYGYAHYKLGYVYWNKATSKEDYGRALTEFKEAIDVGNKYPQMSGVKDLQKNARRDIIPVYALAGDATKAHDFFKGISGDTGGSTDKTFQMMDDLGLNYLDTGHYKEGIDLYTDLMKRDKGDKNCLYQGHISEATLAMKGGAKDAIKDVLYKQLDIYKKYQADSKWSAEAKLKCANLSAGIVSETAMAWHLEAVGSGGIKGTNDGKTMDLAAELYGKIVESFKQEQFAKFEFPRIVKEDWPSIPKIKYAMADLLYARKQWAKCGPAFDAVVAEDPNGPDAPEAAYAAVLCYQNVYTESHQGGSDRKGRGELPQSQADREKKQKDQKASDKEKYAPKKFTEVQAGMIQAFNRYLCYIKPKPEDKKANEDYVEVKYARARTYFEAQHWDEAAAAFRDVAMNHADKEVGIFASQLYLEALNIMGSNVEPAHPSCYDDMAADVPKFIDLYCKGGKEKENAENCSVFNRIQRDIERLQAEELVKAADKGGPEAIKQYEKAAKLYKSLWDKYGEPACKAKDSKGCERADELLYNSARAFQAARLIAAAIDVRKILLNPAYGLDKGALAMKSIYEIGGNYQAIAVYAEAANWYERYAKENPKGDKAAESLQDAVVLRLGLGQEDQAIKDAEQFNKSYGAAKKALAAQIAFAIGAHYVDKGDWDQARKRLNGAMSQIDQNATIDVQIQAHAMLGRTYAQMNTPTNASTEYNKVRTTWGNPEQAMKKFDALGGSEDDKTRRLFKSLTAVGEALFFFAEQKKKEVDKIKFPEYKGQGTREDVLKHINTKVADWIKKKVPAIEAAEAEYLKILALKPPPPRWVIAAGSKVGQMWGKFVAEFRAAPIPKEWKGSGPVPGIPDLTWEEIRGTYYANLDEKSEPQKQRAKAAYKKCLDYSVTYQFFDEYSRKCEEWLSKNYGAEYHLVDEFRGAPSRVNTSLQERARPLNKDGSFFREVVAPPPEDPKPEPAKDGKDAKDPKAAGKDDKKTKEGSALDKAQPKK